MKKSFKLTVRIKDTDKVFAEGWPPGEFASQELHYDLDPEQYERSSFIMHLCEKQEEMLKEHVEVVMEELTINKEAAE